MSKPITMPPSTYGLWDVTTEGYCEGRSTRHLGVHQGHFDEVALKFADKAYYGLCLKWVDPVAHDGLRPTASRVQVSMGIDTGTWNIHGQDRIDAFKRFLKGRPVTVEDGLYHACVQVVAGDSPEARERMEAEVKRNKALAKLSPEDRKALGLE